MDSRVSIYFPDFDCFTFWGVHFSDDYYIKFGCYLNWSERIIHGFACSGSEYSSLDADSADQVLEAERGSYHADTSNHRTVKTICYTIIQCKIELYVC